MTENTRHKQKPYKNSKAQQHERTETSLNKNNESKRKKKQN